MNKYKLYMSINRLMVSLIMNKIKFDDVTVWVFMSGSEPVTRYAGSSYNILIGDLLTLKWCMCQFSVTSSMACPNVLKDYCTKGVQSMIGLC